MGAKPTEITFKTFTQTFMKSLPGEFHYLETPIQIYTLEELYSYTIAMPLPLLKADFNYIVLLDRGSFDQQVGLEIKRVNAGQALLVVQGEVSALLKSTPDVKGFYIIFHDSILQEFKESTYFLKLFTSSPIIQLGGHEHRMISSICLIILQELKEARPQSSVILHLFQSMLLKLLHSSEAKPDLSRQLDIAVSFRTLVLKHFQEHYSIETYASMLNISGNYLNRCVKTVWNKSAKLLTQEITIIQSQKQLEDFSKSIADIAYELNFNDPSYYGRLFKKIIGITPQEYRYRFMHDLSG